MNRIRQLDNEQFKLYVLNAGLLKEYMKNNTNKNDKSLEYILLWQKLKNTSTCQAQQNTQEKGGE